MKKPAIPTYIGEPQMKGGGKTLFRILIIAALAFVAYCFYKEFKKKYAITT